VIQQTKKGTDLRFEAFEEDSALVAVTANRKPRAIDKPMPSQQYLIVFAQAHEDFRIPELRSIAELYGFRLSIENDLDPSRPFGVLALEQEEHVRLLARRCILIK
jgi:hypothetical protein